MAEPDRLADIQGFLDWVRRARVYAVLEPTGQDRRAFVPIQKLQTYFTERDRQNLVEILDAAFLPEDPPLYPENIVPKYTAVFAILLHINKARYIKEFIKHALSDARLPFDLDDPPAKFPTSTEDPNFFSRFYDEQWKFCAPAFQRHMLDEQFEGKRILPITYKERLDGGGSATLYKIKIHKLYNELIPDESKAKLNEESACTFVLKTYITEEARKYYTNEVAAFAKLRPTPNIIEFYGSYIHGDSFNVILEFADKGNLERYFQEEPEPRTGKDIIKFWRGIFMLGKALTGIHQVKPRASADGPPIFQGWHQDIKPDNVLIVSDGARSPYDWQFKLGDLGLSHFTKVVSSGEPTASAAHGTRTYGAPECYRADDWVEQSDITIKQNVDIWSLGCVYSEAARWVAGGWNGLKEYRAERKAETDLIRNFRDGDCFHNGEKALKAVHRSHKETRAGLGRQDHITERAIDIMITEMLGEAAGRPTALQAWIKSQRILDDAQELLDQGGEISRGVRNTTHPPHQQKPPPPAQLPPGVSRDPHRQLAQRGSGVGRASETSSDQYTPPSPNGEKRHSVESTSENTNGPLPSPWSPPQSSPQAARRGLPGKATSRPSQVPQHVSDGQVQYGGTGGMLSDEDQFKQHSTTRYSNPGGSITRRRADPKSVSFDTYPDHYGIPDHNIGAFGVGIARSTTGSLTRRSRDFDHTSGPAVTLEPESFDVDELTDYRNSNGSNPTSRPNLPNNGHVDWYSSQAPAPPTNTSQRPPSEPASLPLREVKQGRDVSHGLSSAIAQPEIAGQQSHSRPEQAKEEQLAGLPALSVEEALAWKEIKKEKKRKGIRASLKDKDLVARLDKRDHLFLIDDSASMKPFWKELKKVFEALSYMVKDCDPNGTDLYFTVSKDHKRDTDTSGFLDMLDKKRLSGLTDIEFRLNEILEEYKTKLDGKPSLVSSFLGIAKREQKTVRPLSIYILTNGMWEAQSTGETPIIHLVQKLKDLGKNKNQVGIQFISFGSYLPGLKKMQILDSGLRRGRKKEDWLDIVDTTPSTGNVWKMLLGAINASYDDDDESFDGVDDDKRFSTTSGSTALTSPVSQPKLDEP